MKPSGGGVKTGTGRPCSRLLAGVCTAPLDERPPSGVWLTSSTIATSPSGSGLMTIGKDEKRGLHERVTSVILCTMAASTFSKLGGI